MYPVIPHLEYNCQMPSPLLYIWDWDDGYQLDHKDQLKGEVLDYMYQGLDQMYQSLD
jgi:hypothetical protein